MQNQPPTYTIEPIFPSHQPNSQFPFFDVHRAIKMARNKMCNIDFVVLYKNKRYTIHLSPSSTVAMAYSDFLALVNDDTTSADGIRSTTTLADALSYE